MHDYSIAAAAVLEATRPKSSGPSVNVHVMRSQREVPPDYDKMRQQIQGEKFAPSDRGETQKK
jgi:hypothetical protein